MITRSFDRNTYQIQYAATANFAGNSSQSVGMTQANWWRLVAVYFRLVTDATVANRVPLLQFETNLVVRGHAFHSTTQGASETIDYTGLIGVQTSTSTNAGKKIFPIPDDLILVGNDHLDLSVVNGVAGDLVSMVRWQFEMWAMPFNI